MCFLRLGTSEGKAQKPTVVIASNLNVYIGNLTNEDAQYEAGELFGFGVGTYEDKEVRGLPANEAAGRRIVGPNK